MKTHIPLKYKSNSRSCTVESILCLVTSWYGTNECLPCSRVSDSVNDINNALDGPHTQSTTNAAYNVHSNSRFLSTSYVFGLRVICNLYNKIKQWSPTDTGTASPLWCVLFFKREKNPLKPILHFSLFPSACSLLELMINDDTVYFHCTAHSVLMNMAPFSSITGLSCLCCFKGDVSVHTDLAVYISRNLVSLNRPWSVWNLVFNLRIIAFFILLMLTSSFIFSASFLITD